MLFESSFFFLSSLSDKRKKEIIEFYNSLDENQQALIDDMLSDRQEKDEFEFGDR